MIKSFICILWPFKPHRTNSHFHTTKLQNQSRSNSIWGLRDTLQPVGGDGMWCKYQAVQRPGCRCYSTGIPAVKCEGRSQWGEYMCTDQFSRHGMLSQLWIGGDTERPPWEPEPWFMSGLSGVCLETTGMITLPQLIVHWVWSYILSTSGLPGADRTGGAELVRRDFPSARTHVWCHVYGWFCSPFAYSILKIQTLPET